MSRRLEQKGSLNSWKLWNLAVLIILVLTFLNLLLMSKLLHSSCTKIYLKPLEFLFAPSSPMSSDRRGSTVVFGMSGRSVLNVDPRVGRWDAIRRYKMIDNAIVGDNYLELSDEYSVCLATQTSVEKLHILAQIVKHWTGPISLAVFIVGDEELALLKEYVRFADVCFPKIRKQVTFHLAFHKQNVPNNTFPIHRMKISEVDCENPLVVLQRLLRMRSKEIVEWLLANPYPQNHMRNLARKNCQTSEVFMTDIDIIPSFGSAVVLNEFFQTIICKNCAFVVPTYELSTKASFPKNKLQLVKLARSGLARPFHQKIFLHNSFATNYSRWEEDTEENPVHISHNVTHLKFYYEPFYISKDNVPPHDERFIGYGLTKNTQVYEMVVAGYRFFVLSPVFTVHWGLQNNVKRPLWRERQNNHNFRKLFNFKREINARYNYRMRSRTEERIQETNITSSMTDVTRQTSNLSEGISVSNKISWNYEYFRHWVYYKKQ